MKWLWAVGLKIRVRLLIKPPAGPRRPNFYLPYHSRLIDWVEVKLGGLGIPVVVLSHIIIYGILVSTTKNMWGYSFEDIAKRAQEEAARLAVRLLFCVVFVCSMNSG